MKRLFCLICVTVLVLSSVFLFNLNYVNAEESSFTSEANLNVTKYQITDNTGYNLSNGNFVNEACYGTNNYVSLKVKTDDGALMDFTYNNFRAFGVEGATFGVYLKLNNSVFDGSWKLNSDSWGTNQNEYVNGVVTGKIESGAIIIQTSTDGVNWSNNNNAKYSNGLYTTNFYNNYKENEVCVYTPSSSQLNNGLYVRVIYAFETSHTYEYVYEWDEEVWEWYKRLLFGIKLGSATKVHHSETRTATEYLNNAEVSEFYVVNNNVDAVTFHNLSSDESLNEMLKDEEALNVDIIRKAETLLNNSMVTKGFVLDNSLNPSINITIKRNNEDYPMPQNKKFTENGKYDFVLTTKLGKTKKMTIYIMNYTVDELYHLYFGDAFLTGKRIYSTGDYQTYEGGLVTYFLKGITEDIPSLYGTMTNCDTGEVVNLNSNVADQLYTISNPGLYEVVLNVNPTYMDEDKSGDNYLIQFHFNVIEQGTAPGPVVNYQNLLDFNKMLTASNLKQVYYGLTFTSAGKGNITLAFSSYGDALEYAYNYEKGTVEKQEDGTYRYNGSLNVKQKISYDNLWDLTDAYYYFASQAIQELYINMNDTFTYATSSNELDTIENLRSLELPRSMLVVIDKDDSDLLAIPSKYPYINSRREAYVSLDSEDYIYNDIPFMFIKDENGYDSDTIFIIDEDGKSIKIKYNESVEEQLKAANCKSGLLTVVESTIYGDTCTYKVVYLAKDDQRTTMELNVVNNNGQNSENMTITQLDHNKTYDVNSFTINSIVDEYDNDGLLIINYNNETTFSLISNYKNTLYDEEGLYQLTLINRFGSSYQVQLNVTNIIYTVDFVDGENKIQVSFKEKETIQVPVLEKYGYVFEGWTYDNKLYNQATMSGKELKSLTSLSAKWSKVKVNINLINNRTNETMCLSSLYDSEVKLPIIKDEMYDAFLGWSLTSSKDDVKDKLHLTSVEDYQLYAVYEPKSYSVTLFSNEINYENKIIYTAYDEIILPTALTRYGYTLDGWTDGTSLFSDKVSGKDLVSMTELTAKWTPVKVNVTFKEEQSETKEYDFDSLIKLPVLNDKAYDNFMGWTYSDCLYTADFTINTVEDITFEASYKPVVYSITFTDEITNYVSTIDYTAYDEIILPTALTRYGYTLDGWTDGTSLFTDKVSGKDLINVTELVATWKVIQVNLTFVNGTSNETIKYDYYSHVTLPILEETGKVFIGWSYQGELISNNKFMIYTIDDITLEAVFEEIVEENNSAEENNNEAVSKSTIELVDQVENEYSFTDSTVNFASKTETTTKSDSNNIPVMVVMMICFIVCTPIAILILKKK